MILATQLGPRLASRVRALLDGAFEGSFSDEDWEHCHGGTHAIVMEGDAPVAHGAVVPRTLWHGGVALRCGYVEGVGVRADHRGHGHGGEVMGALEAVVRETCELGALSATEAGRRLYVARGWLVWRGPTLVRTPDGDIRTPGDDAGVHVLPVTATLDLDGELTCDTRPGDPW